MIGAGNQVGPYTLISKLGSGAYGIVWLAERRTTITTTQVAVKIPLNDEFDIEVIRQEANLWVQASGHPNILPIIEANIYQDQVVIVSEYAPDGSLGNWLKTQTDISLETAIEMTSGILAGLEHLHSRKIIHRDLKPDNILLQGEIARLADFGIAQILRSNIESTMVAGTPAYMPPESFFGNHNLQIDLWATAVIFYRLLTGAMPFPQTLLPLLVKAILEGQFDPLPESVPSPIKEFVVKALQKKPQDRYQSASEMRAALKQAYKNSISNQKPALENALTSEDVDTIFGLDQTRSLYPSLPVSLLSADSISSDNSLELSFESNDISDNSYNNLYSNSYNNLSSNLSSGDKKSNITEFSLPAMLTLQTNFLDQEIVDEYLEPTLKHQLIDISTVNPSDEKLNKQLPKGYVKFSHLLSSFTLSYPKPFILKKLPSLTINTSLFKPIKNIPKKAYFASFIVIVLGLCLLQKNLVTKAYNNFSTSLKISSLNILQNFSLKNFEVEPTVQASSVDISILVGQALNEVNSILIRIENELPADDPTKPANLIRFNGFRYGLEDYYAGNISAQQALQYAESALSQTKTLHIQLDKKKSTLKPIVCNTKKSFKKISIKKLSAQP